MWSTDALYPEEQSDSPSRFNLTVKELLLSGGGDLVGTLTPAPLPQVTLLSASYSLGPGREDLGVPCSQTVLQCPVCSPGLVYSPVKGEGVGKPR